MVRFGSGTYVGFGEIAGAYTSVGDQSDISHWFRLTGDPGNIHLETDLIDLEDLSSYERTIGTVMVGQKYVQGTITVPLTYDQTQNLFRMISGQPVTPALDPTYGTFWHYDSFLPPDFNDPTHYVFGSTPHNYCIEIHTGDGAGNSIFYQGCVITEAKFEFKPNSIVDLTLSFLGRGYSISAKSTPSFSSNWMVTTTNQRLRTSPAPAAFLTMNSATYICYGATFTIGQACEHRHEVTDQEPLEQPVPSGHRRVTIDVDVEAPASDTFWMNIIDAPQKNLIVKNPTLFTSIDLEHDAIFGGIEMGVKPGIEARPTTPGVVRASLSMESYKGAPFQGYVIGVRNQQSAYR